MSKTRKKIMQGLKFLWAVFVGLFVLVMMALCIAVIHRDVAQAVDEIDQSGGLKALTERAWNGAPDTE